MAFHHSTVAHNPFGEEHRTRGVALACKVVLGKERLATPEDLSRVPVAVVEEMSWTDLGVLEERGHMRWVFVIAEVFVRRVEGAIGTVGTPFYREVFVWIFLYCFHFNKVEGCFSPNYYGMKSLSAVTSSARRCSQELSRVRAPLHRASAVRDRAAATYQE